MKTHFFWEMESFVVSFDSSFRRMNFVSKYNQLFPLYTLRSFSMHPILTEIDVHKLFYVQNYKYKLCTVEATEKLVLKHFKFFS